MKKLKMMLLMLLSCFMLGGCQMFQNTEAIQEKIIAAAKNAVIKVAYKKIDERNLDDATKAFLKEAAKDMIEKLFVRFAEEYKKCTQTQIEDSANGIVNDQIDANMTAYLKIAAQPKAE